MDPKLKFTGVYPDEYFPNLQPERGLETTQETPPLGIEMPTSTMGALKLLLDIRNEVHKQAKAWQQFFDEERKRKSAWFHAFSFRLAAGTSQVFDEISGLDARWFSVSTVQTGAAAGSLSPLLYVKFASSITGGGTSLPNPTDWDFVTGLGAVMKPVPVREVQVLTLLSTAPIDGVFYIGGSKDVMPV